MSAVLDASIAVAALSPDEQGEFSATHLALLMLPRLVVPPIWALEVMHVFRRKVLRGAITQAAADQALETLAFMAVQTLDLPAAHCFEAIERLSRRHRLNPYDASYLDAAIRTGLPLATLDQALTTAARLEGIPLLPD
ncbi:MAG: type II toxin-antitoxin system VapC family toxin [Phreatobacter sp.]